MQNRDGAVSQRDPRPAGAGRIAPAVDCLPDPVLAQMEAHALSASGEVCGLIYEKHYRGLRNIAIRPERNYFADPAELARALFLYGEPLAVFHTHADGNLDLSVVDRNLWYYSNSTMIVGCICDGRLRWKMYGNRGD